MASGKTKQKHQPTPPPASVIYMEKALSAGGSTPLGSPIGGESSGSGTGGIVALPASSARKLQTWGGPDSRMLREIATSRLAGASHSLPKGTHPSRRVAAPSAFGSAVDAGSGMRVLFAVILGSALLIGAAFVQRRRHR